MKSALILSAAVALSACFQPPELANGHHPDPGSDAGVSRGHDGPYCDGSEYVVPYADGGAQRYACRGPGGCDGGVCDQSKAYTDDPCIVATSTSCSDSLADQQGGLPTNQLVCDDGGGGFVVDRECALGCAAGQCVTDAGLHAADAGEVHANCLRDCFDLCEADHPDAGRPALEQCFLACHVSCQ